MKTYCEGKRIRISHQYELANFTFCSQVYETIIKCNRFMDIYQIALVL